MKQLITLFLVFLFFIVLSVAIGAGVWCIEPTYAKEATGSLLILSALVTAVEFFKEFGGN